MSFLFPLAWALAALALPVAALYLIRTRPQARRASTLLFWRQLPPQVYNSAFWRRLRRWASLALQLLLLLLLVFALARPGREGAEKAALILVLDGSASMAASGRTEAAQAAARRALAELGPFDEALILQAAETPRILSGWSRNRRALTRALAGAEPASGPGAAAATLALAHDLARQRSSARLLFLTDGVWAELPPATLLEGVALHLVGEGTPPPRNAGLTFFGARRSLAAPGEYQLLARAIATHDTTATLELWCNGRLMDARQLGLKAGEPWQQTWEAHEAGSLAFEARLTDLGPADALPTDNHAATQLGAVRPVAVSVVSEPNLFLEAALASLPAVEVEWRSPADPPPDPARFSIYHRATPPQGATPRALLLLALEAGGPWGEPGGELAQALVSSTREEEPFLRHVALETLRIGKAREFTPGPGALVYAESFGKPLLFGQWSREPRWLVATFGLEEGDLVFRTAFPILLGNLVQTLRAGEEPPPAPLPGEAESLLKPAPEAVQSVATPAPAAAWGGWPLWWWALAAGVLWVVLEWTLFHRRITE